LVGGVGTGPYDVPPGSESVPVKLKVKLLPALAVAVAVNGVPSYARLLAVTVTVAAPLSVVNGALGGLLSDAKWVSVSL
jgi:hypothetical protein